MEKLSKKVLFILVLVIVSMILGITKVFANDPNSNPGTNTTGTGTDTLTLTVKNGAKYSSYDENERIGVIYTLLMADKLVKENGPEDMESFQLYKDQEGKLVLMYEEQSGRFAYGDGYHNISYEITDDVRNAMQADINNNSDYDDSYKNIIQNIIDNIKQVELKFASVSHFLINIDGLGRITYAYEEEELSYDKDDMSQSCYVPYIGTYKVGAKADDGWKFVKWTKNGEDYSTNPEITVTLEEENFELVAVFDMVEDVSENSENLEDLENSEEPEGSQESEKAETTNKSNNPTTGDNITTLTTIFVIAMLGAFISIRLNKRL